jgi:type VII secretion protein EccE
LVAVELLLTAVALAAGRSVTAVAAAGTVAALGLVLVLGRHAHRPLLDWVLVWLRRRRRNRAGAVRPGDPQLAALREVLPSLGVGGIALRDDQRLAVCFDGTGWSAVVALHREADILPDPATAPRVPMGVLAQVLRVDDIPLSGLQVLVHTVPAPDSRLTDAPIADSYWQLAGGAFPAVRETFLILRLDARGGREAIEARGGGSDGACRALKRCTSRLLELLEAASVPARPLAETPWQAALLEVAGLSAATTPTGHDAGAAPAARAPQGRLTREQRRGLQAGELTHVTWWVRGFPESGAPLDTLVNLTGQVPATAAQASFTLYPAPSGEVRCRGLLRTAHRSPDLVEAAAVELQRRAAAAGVDLQRLDGEHGLGYLSTLPLGGGTL